MLFGMPDPHFLYSQLFAQARPASGYVLWDGHSYDQEMPIEIGRLGFTILEAGTWRGLWEILSKKQCGHILEGTVKGNQTYTESGNVRS